MEMLKYFASGVIYISNAGLGSLYKLGTYFIEIKNPKLIL